MVAKTQLRGISAMELGIGQKYGAYHSLIKNPFGKDTPRLNWALSNLIIYLFINIYIESRSVVESFIIRETRFTSFLLE